MKVPSGFADCSVVLCTKSIMFDVFRRLDRPSIFSCSLTCALWAIWSSHVLWTAVDMKVFQSIGPIFAADNGVAVSFPLYLLVKLFLNTWFSAFVLLLMQIVGADFSNALKEFEKLHLLARRVSFPLIGISLTQFRMRYRLYFLT